MKKSQAKEILGYNWEGMEDMPLEERFQNFRDLYYPKYYEFMSEHNEQEIKREMYKKMIHAPETLHFVETEEATSAFLKFADVHDAYNILAKTEDYNEHSVEYSDIREYDEKRYGKKAAKYKYIGERIASYGLALTILWILSLLLGGLLVETKIGILFRVAFYTLGPMVLITRIADVVSSPIEHIFLIPLILWDVFTEDWSNRRKGVFPTIVFVIVSLIQCAIALFFALIIFFFNPHSGSWYRVERCKSNKAYKEFCFETVDARYDRTLRDMEKYELETRCEKYFATADAFLYYAKKYGSLPEDLVLEGRRNIMQEGSFYSFAVDNAHKRIQKVEDELTNAAIAAARGLARAERRASYMLSEGEITRDTGLSGIHYSYSEYESDIEAAEEKAAEKYNNAVSEAEKKRAYRQFDLKVINTRIILASLADVYSKEVKDN